MESSEPLGLVESTRRALERAALDLISRQGFAATTAAEIAAAGFTERTFFRYFEQKEDVVFSTIESRFDAFVPGLRKKVLSEGLNADSLLAAFHDALDADPEMRAAVLDSNADPRQPGTREGGSPTTGSGSPATPATP